MKHRKTLAYALLSWPPHAVGYVAAPLLVSRLGHRHGLGDVARFPNLLGVPLIAAGASIIVWAILSHYRSSPADLQLTPIPHYLVTSGAYAYTRNPLYVGGAAMWMGWSLVLLSVPVVFGALLLFGALAVVGVPFEERMLTARFGAEYRDYQTQVPRGIGRRRR